MKRVFSRMFGSLRSGLATGALLGLAVLLPVSTSAADAVKIEGSMGVANVTAGDTDYKPAVNATYDQVVKLQVYYHNQEDPASNKAAENVRVKIAMPTEAGKAQKVSSTVKGDNTNEVKDEVTVNLDRDDATLQYIPGSAIWKHNTGSREAPTITETKISDDVVLGGQGVVLENQKPCYEYASTVTVLARVMVPSVKVVKESQLKADTGKWSNNNTAKPGDTMKYIISYQNTGNTEQKQVVIRDSLPAKLELVPGTTKVYNASNGEGTAITNDNITNGGVVIGNYGPGANAYVIFEAKIAAADQLTCGSNELRNVGVVRPEGMNEYYNTAVTTVKRDCAGTGAATPAYSCDLLTVTKGDGRKVAAKVDYSATNGAKLKNVTYDFGDGSTPLTTDKTTVDYTYQKDGNFTVTAKLVVTANNKDETVTSAACAKPVSYTTPAAPVATEELPATGAGSVIGLFVATSIVGFIGHRLFLSRRLSN